jgi:hypothetical protein
VTAWHRAGQVLHNRAVSGLIGAKYGVQNDIGKEAYLGLVLFRLGKPAL